MRITYYILATKEMDSIDNPNKTLGLECFVDADFANGWTQAGVDHPDNMMLLTGYMIFCVVCPVGQYDKYSQVLHCLQQREINLVTSIL